MGLEELGFASASELAGRIRTKEISPVEVVKGFLERIERYNPLVNAYCTVAADEALAAAEKAEKVQMKGGKLPPLLGVPVAIKDLTPTQGLRTTYGSKIFAHHVPKEDSVFVKRVKAAGGIILGKTNTPEFGHTGITDNLLFGRTNNPWDTSRASGGSSGGSAAAVAAGLAPLAEGSDGGGSIRIPASLCGVYGLKATFGRVPFDTGPNAFSASMPFLHHGSLTRTVEDAALLLDIVQGPDASDPYSVPNSRESYRWLSSDVAGLKIAYSPNLDYFEIDSEVAAVTGAAVKNLENVGVSVETLSLGFEDGQERITKTFTQLWAVYYAAYYGHFLPHWEQDMSKGLLSTIRMGEKISTLDYKRLENQRSFAYGQIEKVFEHYDILVTPTLAVTAFPHGPGPRTINGKKVDPYTGWMLTSLFNLTGHPAASINCGYSAKGMPIGLQIIGKRFAEDTVLVLSKAVEKNTDGVRRPQGY